MPKEKPINYDEPVKARLKDGYGPKLMPANALNGALPLCECHSIPGGMPAGTAVLHPGQVIFMRRGELMGEPNDDGVMNGGRADFEPAGDAEPYVIPDVGPNGPGNETPVDPSGEHDIPVIDDNPPAPQDVPAES